MAEETIRLLPGPASRQLLHARPPSPLTERIRRGTRRTTQEDPPSTPEDEERQRHLLRPRPPGQIEARRRDQNHQAHRRDDLAAAVPYEALPGPDAVWRADPPAGRVHEDVGARAGDRG